MIAAAIQIPGGPDTVIRTDWWGHGVAMDQASTPDFSHWSFLIDGVPKAATACAWANYYQLDVSYSGVAPVSAGHIFFNTHDPLLRDYNYRIGYAPSTIQFF